MIYIIIHILIFSTNVLLECAYYPPNKITWFITLCNALVTNLFSCWVFKNHSPTRLPWIPGAFDILKYQFGSHILKQNFEIFCARTSPTSKGIIQSKFFEGYIFCTPAHHLCNQSRSFKETLNFLMMFLTMDESCPILGSAEFPNVSGVIFLLGLWNTLGSVIYMFYQTHYVNCMFWGWWYP